MKIDNHIDLANTLSRAAVTKQSAKGAATAAASETASRSTVRVASAGVPVTLSENIRSATVGRNSADFNADKVAAMKEAIDKGTYRPNPEVVADKMLDNAAEALTHAKLLRSH